MTRKDVEEQIKSLSHFKDHNLVRSEMETWLKKNCTDFEAQQILNDLESYPEFMEGGLNG